MPLQKIKGLAFPFRFGTSGAVEMSSGVTHIQESIYQLISTQPGERVMEVEYGCLLRDVIFSNLDITTVSIIRDRIIRAIERWEPNVIVKPNDITVEMMPDRNTVVVTVQGHIKGSLEPLSVQVEFRR